jgi:hypothetical protein
MSQDPGELKVFTVAVELIAAGRWATSRLPADEGGRVNLKPVD